MGFFSWKTQDTKRSIANIYSDRDTFPVTMTDNNGNKWREEAYEGYGMFGGKDYYELVAEMNGETTREEGINIYLGIRGIIHKRTGIRFRGQGVDFFHWSDEKLHNGLSANQLLETDEWEGCHEFKEGRKLPNLTEDHAWAWIDEGPKSCDYQGYFY